MIIPLRTDRDFRRRPIVTESLIVVNLLVYLLMTAGNYFGWFDILRFTAGGWFDPQQVKLWQLLTYQFLHSPESIWHLVFNMLFLWIFGGAVEDRMGRVSFLLFYLLGGVFAALAHAQVVPNPVIGASGSIAAITGAFLALFPRSTIRVFVFFFIIGIFHIPSLWFIGFFFAIDLLRQVGDLLGVVDSNVAYMAHLAGYLYGFTLAFTLLAMKIIKHEDCDVFYLFKQSRRRAAFRSATKATPAGMWDAAPLGQSKRPVKMKQRALTEAEQRDSQQRTEINRLMAEHDLSKAAAVYRDLLKSNNNAAMTEDRQLDLANQLYAQSDHAVAARAYELFLESYPGSSSASQVRLILAILYIRHLNKAPQARALIEQAQGRLDESQQQLAKDLLSELGPA